MVASIPSSIPSAPIIPQKMGEASIQEIVAALSRPLPDRLLSRKTMGKQSIVYISWYQIPGILDKYAPGWKWEILSVTTTPDRIFLVGRLTIPTRDGEVWRDATGTEELSCGSYGDPSSNAESMAFRRAAAKFGLGLYLYQKD